VYILLSPVITRLYTPESMGFWGLFVSFLGVASVATNLRYEVAIVATPSDEDALTLTRSCLVLSIFVSLLVTFLFEGFRRVQILGYEVFPPWADILVFLALLFLSWGTALRYYAVRIGGFQVVGRFTIIQGIARPLGQVLLFFAGGSGLLLGETIGRMTGLSRLWRILPKVSRPWFSLALLKRNKIYPLIQLPSALLDTLASMALVPVFTALYGSTVGGYLALTQRVVALPVSLIGTAVADVFYSQAAELAREKPHALRRFLLVTCFRLFLIALPFGFALWFFAPRLTPWIFGGAWEKAGNAMAIMAPWMIAQLTVYPVTRAIFLSSWSWVKLIYDLCAVASFAFIFLIQEENFSQALKILSWIQVLLYTIYLVILLWVCDTKLLATTEKSLRSIQEF
jgi:O-antigen/teichoic acid export membrane protein